MVKIIFLNATLGIVLMISACSDQGNGRESTGDKSEWSILQVARSEHRSQISQSPEFTTIGGYELLSIPNLDNTDRIWIMLWPKSPPYYKQMPIGNYSIQKKLINELASSGRISSTVEEALRSHEAQ
jgi:hypothetical protein